MLFLGARGGIYYLLFSQNLKSVFIRFQHLATNQ